MAKRENIVTFPASAERPTRVENTELPSTLIITTQPDTFKPVFSERLGVDVHIVDNAEAVFTLLASINCTRIYADFRQLPGVWKGVHWSAQSFLRTLKATPATATIDFYVMADSWERHQEEWLTARMGAKGLIKRSPTVIGRAMGVLPVPSTTGAPAPVPMGAKTPNLDRIDSNFRLHAGPMAEVHINGLRHAIATGHLIPEPNAYAKALAARLTNPAARSAFLAATVAPRKVKPSNDNPKTSSLDPWMTQVNALYVRFAGGIGARLFIAAALDELGDNAEFTRADYLAALEKRLSNPTHRAAFTEAVAAANL